jgi:CHAD domain-containing protein
MTKWLPDVAPDDRTVDVAARALASRLDAVRQYLQRAANAGGVEDVHQLRVWTRRTDAALHLYAELIRNRDLQWFRKWLKRLRRAAGQVRDRDVFAPRVTEPGEKWPARLVKDRRGGMKKIRSLATRLDDGRRFKRRTRRLLKRLDTDGVGAARFGDFARTKLGPIVSAFFAAAPSATAESRAIHQFRIRGKELRYALELLAGALPPPMHAELYAQVRALQERLGKLNDLSVAAGQLTDWLATTGSPAMISRLQRHLAETNDELVQARNAFRAWWTADALAELRERFAEVLGQ